MTDTPEEQQHKAQLTEAFLTELRELMKKHGVESITAEDHWHGYAECGEDIRITAEIKSLWEDDELKRPFIEINLGRGFYQEP